ncbi:MAG: PfkB family carbohydrate kinase [Candidatus Omnitrophota bacterium]
MPKKFISIIIIITFLSISIPVDYSTFPIPAQRNTLRPMTMVNSKDAIRNDQDFILGLTRIQEEKEFIEIGAKYLLEMVNKDNPIEGLRNLFASLVKRANEMQQPGLTALALKAAFDSFKDEPAKQRSFNAIMREAIGFGNVNKGTEEHPPRVKSDKMVWTITTSPTIDIDAKERLENWDPEETVMISPGGGGINVSIGLARLGVQSRAIFFYGGETGEDLKKLVQMRGVNTADAIKLKEGAETRVTMVTSLDKVNSLLPQGTPVDENAREELVKKLMDEEDGVKDDDIVMISGSLAPGLSDTFYAELGEMILKKCPKAKVIVDTKGEPAKAVLSAKPAVCTTYSGNREEFAAAVGVKNFDDTQLLLEKAQEIIKNQPPDEGIKEIIVTLDEEGAFTVTREWIHVVKAPNIEKDLKLKVESAVGAGDTFRAGLIAGILENLSPLEALVKAVASGTVSVCYPGTGGGKEGEVKNVGKVIHENEYIAEHVLVKKPFEHGELPPASIVQKERLTAKTTSYIAMGMYMVRGLVGLYHYYLSKGFTEKEALNLAEMKIDDFAQEILVRLYYKLDITAFFMAVEGAKRAGVGALTAGRALAFVDSDLKFNLTNLAYVIADVIEGSELVAKNITDKGGSGACSFCTIGPLAQVMPRIPDECGAGLVLFPVLPDKIKAFSLEAGKPLDPDADVGYNLERAINANDVTYNDLDVYIMDRNRLTEEYLKPLYRLQSGHNGLKIIKIHHGSHDAALRAMLGRYKDENNNERVPVFIGTAGATEAVSDYLTAILFDNVVVGFKIYGEYSKTIGDYVGSLNKTLRDVGETTIKEMCEKGIIAQEEILDLNLDTPIRHLFCNRIKERLKKLNPQCAEDIIKRPGWLFHNESIVYPKVKTDKNIVLYGPTGEPENIINGVKYDDLILSCSTSHLTKSKILGLEPVSQRYPGYWQTPTLIIERINGKTYVWVQDIVHNEKVIKELLPLEPFQFYAAPGITQKTKLSDEALVAINTAA